MITFDDFRKENIKKQSKLARKIPDYLYRILIIGGFGSGKTNSLFNLTSREPDIDKKKVQA